jgi:two-component system chemotaxis response regulator CheB
LNIGAAALAVPRLPDDEHLVAGKQIRVLVVDDSVVMREVLRAAIEGATDMIVVGTAADGRHALEQVKKLQPDVLTLDVQMPHMDGLATLEVLFAQQPLPVIMVSSLTTAGAKTTLEALDRGALDCVPKPVISSGGSTAEFQDELRQKIRWAATVDVRRVLANRRTQPRRASPWPAPVDKTFADTPVEELNKICIAVGTSMGGPPALAALFSALRPPLPPILVVQHMMLNFTAPLAWRLDGISALSVNEAKEGDLLRPNHALIAPSGRHLLLKRVGDRVKVVLDDSPRFGGHKPAVDLMMQSAAHLFGRRCLGVIMTGMGCDGVLGCAAIRTAGGFVLGQDEATSDVYGMNKAAYQAGHVDRQFALGDVGTVIAAEVKRLLALRKAAPAEPSSVVLAGK